MQRLLPGSGDTLETLDSEQQLVPGAGDTVPAVPPAAPFALRFDGTNDHATLATGITIGSAEDFSIRWKFLADANSGNHRILGGVTFAASSPRIILFSGGNATLYGDGGVNKSFAVSIDTTVDREVEFRRVSGDLGIYYDGVIQGSTLASTQVFTDFKVIGGNFSTATIASELQYLEIDVASTFVAAFSAAESDHVSGAPVLTETIAGNDATGVNMPTDGSAWIDLSAAEGRIMGSLAGQGGLAGRGGLAG